MSHCLFPLPGFLAWWYDIKQRQAYVQACFAGRDDTCHDWLVAVLHDHLIHVPRSGLINWAGIRVAVTSVFGPEVGAWLGLDVDWVWAPTFPKMNVSLDPFLSFSTSFPMMIYSLFITTVNIKKYLDDHRLWQGIYLKWRRLVTFFFFLFLHLEWVTWSNANIAFSDF